MLLNRAIQIWCSRKASGTKGRRLRLPPGARPPSKAKESTKEKPVLAVAVVVLLAEAEEQGESLHCVWT